jgi:hypothetical protein
MKLILYKPIPLGLYDGTKNFPIDLEVMKICGATTKQNKSNKTPTLMYSLVCLVLLPQF